MKNCNLILENEVLCRFEGLDSETINYCENILAIYDPNAYFSPTFKAKQWDGKIRFFTKANQGTYINLLDKILPQITKKYIINIVDKRYPINVCFKQVNENLFSSYKWPTNHKLEGQSIILEEHQVRLINSLLNNRQGMIEAATGAGKTLIIAALANEINNYGRMIIIVPKKDLILQTCSVLRMVGLDVGEFYGGKKELDKKVTVCTWQSLQSVCKNTKEYKQLTHDEIITLIENQFALIADECHQATAKVFFNLLSKQFAYVPIRWGMSGTIPKQKFKMTKLNAILGDIIETVKSKELQNKGFLAESNITMLKLIDDKDFIEYDDEVEYICSDIHRAKYLTNLLYELSTKGNTVILVPRIDIGVKIQKCLNDIEIDAPFLEGKVKAKDRAKKYKELQEDDNKIMIATYQVASTGIDIQRIHFLILFEAGKSEVNVFQSIGRGLRKGNDKQKIEILDIFSSNKYSEKHAHTRTKYYKKAKHPYNVVEIKNWK